MTDVPEITLTLLEAIVHFLRHPAPGNPVWRVGLDAALDELAGELAQHKAPADELRWYQDTWSRYFPDPGKYAIGLQHALWARIQQNERTIQNIETYLLGVGDSELIYSHIRSLLQQEGRGMQLPLLG